MQIRWLSSKVNFINIEFIEAHEDMQKTLQSICAIVMFLEAKEDELGQLMTQKLGISTKLAN